MPRRRHYRRRQRRRRSHVSESSATYSKWLAFAGTTAGSANQTKLDQFDLDGIVNEGTTNRKIVGIRGMGSLSSTMTNASIGFMWAYLAHPILEDVPTVADFDPFNAGPSTPGQSSPAYEGRPSPRPFGRHTIVQSCDGNDVQTLFHTFGLSTKAKRLLRPGWKLTGLLYTKCSATSASFNFGAALRITVEG